MSEIWKILKTKVSVSEKKCFGSDTVTEIGTWFRLSIPKPGFDCSLIIMDYAYKLYNNLLDMRSILAKNLTNFDPPK